MSKRQTPTGQLSKRPLSQNQFTQNALTQNALTQNALTQNALTQNTAPSFPAGLVPPRPLGHAITSIAMPPTPSRALSAPTRQPAPNLSAPALSTPALAAGTPRKAPKRKAPKSPISKPTAPTEAPVIALPQRSEPLVTPACHASATPSASPAHQPQRALITQPPALGLLGAIGQWLGSVGALLSLEVVPAGASGWLMLRRRRQRTAEMRRADDLAQLRAENRWLRMKLHALEAKREADRAKSAN